MGAIFSTKIDRNVLLLGREKAGKTYLLYKLKGLQQPQVELLPTRGYNHFQIDFSGFERQIEVWDPSGSSSHTSFWSTFYKTVYFHCIVYVLDARLYDPNADHRQRAAVICSDKMELHTLLCDDDLSDTQILLYLNWKPDTSGRPAEESLRSLVKSTVTNDLELHTAEYLPRNIVVVDEILDLHPHMLHLPHRLPGSDLMGEKKKAKAKEKAAKDAK